MIDKVTYRIEKRFCAGVILRNVLNINIIAVNKFEPKLKDIFNRNCSDFENSKS